MLKVIDLVASLRFALGDMQGLSISDYELIEAINQAASLLYGRLSEHFISSEIKRKVIDVDESREYILPPDFLRVHQVIDNDYRIISASGKNPPEEGNYRIIGSAFSAPEGVYTLEYYYIPSRVSSVNDFLDVSEKVRPYIENVALYLYRKDFQSVELSVQQCLTVLAGREISHFDDTGPVQVLGGRL